MTQLFGHEFLLAAKYPKAAIRYLPKGRGGKVFLKEAGDALLVIVGWAKKGVHPILAAQGLWRGGAHDYSGAATLKEGLTECKRFSKVARDYPHLEFEFSIFCEHRLKRAYLKTVYGELMEIVEDIPNLTLVNTPMTGGDYVAASAVGVPAGRFKNEIHGTANPSMNGYGQYNWACDGLHAVDCDIQAFKNRHAKASIIWLWIAQYNCKMRSDEATLIKDRKVKPIEKQIISVDHLCDPKGPTRYDSKSLWKSHSDQHGIAPEGREQKPVIITPVNVKELRLVAANGRGALKVPRSGTYLDGRSLYRVPMWGYELQNRVHAMGGSSIVDVTYTKDGKTSSLGKVNPAFRENSYRSLPNKATTTSSDIEDETLTNIGMNTPIDVDWV